MAQIGDPARPMRLLAIAVAALTGLLLLAPSALAGTGGTGTAPGGDPGTETPAQGTLASDEDVATATAYLDLRRGRNAFAVIGPEGAVHGVREDDRFVT